MVQARHLRVAVDGHVVGRRATGNETYVVNIVDALVARSDIEPVVFVDEGVDWPGTSTPTLRRLRLRTPFLRIPLELPLAARRARADLLHVQYVAPPVTGLPVVSAIHDVSFEDVPGFFGRATAFRLKRSVRRTARMSAMVVTISEFTKARIVHHYDIDPDRIAVTPLAVSPRWRPLDPDERARRLRGLDLPPQFVLAVGNLHPRKNIPRLVRALAAGRRDGLGDVGLVLAGQRGWHAGEVDEAIAQADAAEWVRFVGFVTDDQLQALYGSARLVAYPSLYEGFGLPVLEALACGAIVVASNTTAIPEVAGSAALLVDPGDDAAVAEGVVRAATDEGLRERLRDAGPRQAALFSWDRTADLTARAYRSAVDRAAS